MSNKKMKITNDKELMAFGEYQKEIESKRIIMSDPFSAPNESVIVIDGYDYEKSLHQHNWDMLNKDKVFNNLKQDLFQSIKIQNEKNLKR